MTLRVFLVEDMDNMLTLMTELCQALGGLKIVATRSTEAEAIQWLEANVGAWDLAIMDLVLSQGSGINLVKRARATQPGGRIAVFSGYASPGVEKHCRLLGADVVFDKRDTRPFVEWLESTVRLASGPAPLA